MAAFSLLVGQVGVGEAANPREERRVERWHARNVETGRGAVCGRWVACNRPLRSEVVEVVETR